MGVKTNIKDIPVANGRLVKETALETREKPEDVEAITKHIGQFIAQTMGRGLMEGVMIPGFGKFQPKLDILKAMHKKQSDRRSGMDKLQRIVSGKEIKG